VGRTVTLVLVDATGAVLGALPPFGVDTPWRQEVAEVVAGAAREYGTELTVLRLLVADGEEVTYLAEVATHPNAPLRTVDVDLRPHPLRARYAEPGGPSATLDWASAAIGPAHATQLRTWNLSSIWRLETALGEVGGQKDDAGGTAWLKEVPAFFRHEGALLGWLATRHPGLAPRPLAVDEGRMLLADVPGTDRYGAPAEDRLPMLRALHEVQRQAPARLPELRALGVPEKPLAAGIRTTVLKYGDPKLLDGLDERLAALAACGLPDTLVHGDFHPGNVRGVVILDWGDSFLGHPVFDVHRMVEDLPEGAAAPLVAEWCRWWRAAVPGCEPERAYLLSEPVVALRNAMTYADFLDRIEPAEHVYHAGDVPAWLDRAAALLAAAQST
jgi:Phosphotransferase enzyme family